MDHLATVTDLSTLLPPEGKRRFHILSDAVSDDAARSAGFSAQILDRMDDRDRARRRRAEVKSLRGVTDDHPEVLAQDRMIAECDGALARLNQRAEAHSADAGPRANLLRDVKDWIRSVAPNHDLVDIELIDMKLGRGEPTPTTAVEKARRRLRELSADANRISSSPFPSSYCKAVAAAYLDKIAAAPIVTNLIEHGGGLFVDGKLVEEPIIFGTKQVRGEVGTVAGAGASLSDVPDAVGLVAFVCRDLLLARIGELIDAEAEDRIALTHEQRRERLATIAADRERVELEESYWLWQAFAAGKTIEPRSEMDVSAFLMVKPITAQRPAPFDHAAAFAVARQAVADAEGQPLPGMAGA